MPHSTIRAERESLLLVDDDDVLTDVLERAFQARGFDVRVAWTAEEAEEAIFQKVPEYAVIDLRVGNRNGLEIVSMLHDVSPRARIVVLTAYGSIATAIEAIKRGATYYLCKPVTADDIVVGFRHQAGDGVPRPRDKPLSIKRLEWEHLWRVLVQHDRNISQAARALSMHRRTLQRKLAKRPVRD